MTKWWVRIDSWPAHRWLILALCFMALLYGYSIWHNQSTIIVDGRRAFWLHDDMMISMRYGRNLATGQGLVWNPGQPKVEGFSNFGWVLVMTAVHWLPLPDTLTSLAMLTINVVLAGLVLVQTTRLARRLAPKPGLWLLAALITLVIVVDLARWTTIGLEVPLQTAVFLWLLIRVLDESTVNRPRPSTFFMAGLLGLIRVDGPVLAFLLCLVAFSLQPDKKRVLLYAPLTLMLPLVHVVFRLAYYGYPLPNTYYLKLAAFDQRFLPGLGYILKVVQLYWPILLAALAAVFYARDKRVTLLLLMGLPLAAYAIFVGGDDFGGARFFAPWLPVLILLAFMTPRFWGWQTRPILTASFMVGLTLLTALTGGYRIYQGPGQEAVLAKSGSVLEETTWPTSNVGVFWAGTLPYFAHRPSVDLLGKNDERVARLPANEGSFKPGHNKFDYDYSLNDQQPALLVSPLSLGVVSDPQRFPAFTAGDDAYAGQLFLNAAFQQNYAPTLLYIETVPFFIRTDSAERERLLSQSECEPRHRCGTTQIWT